MLSAILQSVKSELERQNTLRLEAEHRSKEADVSLRSTQAKSKQLIGALQGQVEQHANATVWLNVAELYT